MPTQGIKLVKSVVGGKHKRRMDLSRDVEMLRHELTLDTYAMVVFDPISAYEGAAGGDGNANTNPAVRGFVAPSRTLAHDFDVVLLFKTTRGRTTRPGHLQRRA